MRLSASLPGIRAKRKSGGMKEGERNGELKESRQPVRRKMRGDSEVIKRIEG